MTLTTNIIYVSVQCSTNTLNRLFHGSKNVSGQGAQKFNRLFAEGLAAQDSVRVTAVSQVPVNKRNCKKTFLKLKKEVLGSLTYHYLPVVNIHRLQDMINTVTGFFNVLFLSLRNRNTVIYADVLAAPAAYGALCAAKITGKKYIGIVTDVPDVLFINGDRAYHIFSNRVLRKSDAYILLTEQMNELVNPNHKPYVVIEGMVDGKQYPAEKPSSETVPRVCLYTGTINRMYGIEELVNGFLMADMPDLELHIYGDGDYKEELNRICAEHPNVKYFGSILNDEMIKIQQKADLLINPRSSEGEYTKYSFPSKNLEYMVSGTPAMFAMLPGIPEEYREYIVAIKDTSAQGICRELKDFFAGSSQERKLLGERAREFVLLMKNNIVQSQKTLTLLEKK